MRQPAAPKRRPGTAQVSSPQAVTPTAQRPRVKATTATAAMAPAITATSAKPPATKAKATKAKRTKAKVSKRQAAAPTIQLTKVEKLAQGQLPEPVASVTQLAPRIAERKHRQRQGLWLRIASGTAATLFVGAATWLVAFSEYLALDAAQVEVTAEPDSLVDLNSVVGLVQQKSGTPLARVSTRALVEQVMDFPAVKAAQVSRVWPSGLAVNIESRIPVGAVATDAGYTWIDATGVPLGDFADSGGLVSLQGPLDQPQVLADALVIWDGLTPQLQEKIRNLSASTTDDIFATLHSGQTIRWGSTEQLKLKVATVEALLDRAPSSPVFDVSSPTLPITR